MIFKIKTIYHKESIIAIYYPVLKLKYSIVGLIKLNTKSLKEVYSINNITKPMSSHFNKQIEFTKHSLLCIMNILRNYMAYNDGGYKITINAKTSKEEILNAFTKIFTYLQDVHGVEEFGKINLYFQMYKDDERQMLIDPTTLLADECGYNLSPEKTHKTYEDLPDGSKKISFQKTLNGERLEKTENYTIETKPFKTTSKLIAISKIDKIRLQVELEREARQKKENEEYQVQLLKKREIQEQENAIFNNFKIFIAKKLNCNVNELQLHTTSLAYLKDKKTFLKYLKGKEIPKEEKVFRVTYKDPQTKKASTIEIFNMKLELLNQLDY